MQSFAKFRQHHSPDSNVCVCSAPIWCDAMQSLCKSSTAHIFIARESDRGKQRVKELTERAYKWTMRLYVCECKCHEEKQFHLQEKQVIQTINASKSKIKFRGKSLLENFVQKYTPTHKQAQCRWQIIFCLLASSQWKCTLWSHSSHSITVVRACLFVWMCAYFKRHGCRRLARCNTVCQFSE